VYRCLASGVWVYEFGCADVSVQVCGSLSLGMRVFGYVCAGLRVRCAGV
jgi:hypothetical protein